MKRDYPEAPLVGVGIICFRGGDVLMIKRGKPPRAGSWSLPGGRQKLGETLRDCALRELVQETGVEAEIGPLVDVVDSMTRDEDGGLQFHYTLVDFRADWISGEPRAGGDAADARWFTPAELAKMDLWQETRRVIELARGIK
jgi:ADP-ribose pyrophosphatase YjhB (NUDIX family)